MAPRTLAALVLAVGQAAQARLDEGTANQSNRNNQTSNRSDCLPDAMPAHLRTKVIRMNDDRRPLGIWTLEWPSGRIVAEILNILAHEKLGYQTRTHGGGSSTSLPGFLAVAGCTNSTGCGNATSDWHVVLEVWGYERDKAITQQLQQAYPGIMPEQLGSIGYSGLENLFILDAQRAAAWEAEGLSLEWHRSYNHTWHAPEKYFDNPTVFHHLDSQLDLFQPCWETEMGNPIRMAEFLEYTGDADGVVNDSQGYLRAKCWNESWWYSPSCRDNVTGCVFTFSGGTGWGVAAIMQKAVYYGMALGIAVAATESTYEALARQYAPAFYYWEPATAFVGMILHPMSFETYDPQAWAAGDARSNSPIIQLGKLAWHDLFYAAPDVRELVITMSLPEATMDELLFNLTATGDSPRAVACSFMRGHPEVWTSWLAIPTNCIDGQGMVDEMKNHTDTRELAVDCAWCPQGFRSHRIVDDVGPTTVCRPCPPGSFQPLPGEYECESCPSGSYIDKAGSIECKMCEVGKYQPDPNMSVCVECDGPKTTVLFGAEEASDCVCPSEMYQALSGECADCAQGLACPVGTKESNIPPGPGLTAASCNETADCIFPVPLPGYYTTYSEPFSVFYCMNAISCPGNEIESCGTLMTGLVCAVCEDGYFRNNDECVKCNSLVVARVRFACLPFLIGVPGILILYRINKAGIEHWSNPGKQFAVVLYTLLAYCQTIALVLETQAELPQAFVDSLAWTNHLYDYTQILRIDCLFDFEADLIRRLVAPAAVALFFVATYGVSILLARQCQRPWMHLDKDRLLDCYGTLGFTFYISIAANALYLFRCYKHPNGMSSLLMSPEILCHSAPWEKYLGFSILAVLVFCVASLVLISWVLYVAPREFQDPVFRTRWKFILLKFRPSVWWWGLAVLCKGLWVNLTTVLWEGGAWQMAWVMSGVLFYASATYFLMPWRFYSVSCLDAVQSCFLVVLLTFSTNFVVDSDRTVKELYWGVQMTLLIPVVSSCGIGARILIRKWMTRKSKKGHVHMSEKELQEMCQVFDLMGHAKNWSELVVAMRAMSDSERFVLMQARRIITSQLSPTGDGDGGACCTLSTLEAAVHMQRSQSFSNSPAGVATMIKRSLPMLAGGHTGHSSPRSSLGSLGLERHPSDAGSEGGEVPSITIEAVRQDTEAEPVDSAGLSTRCPGGDNSEGAMQSLSREDSGAGSARAMWPATLAEAASEDSGARGAGLDKPGRLPAEAASEDSGARGAGLDKPERLAAEPDPPRPELERQTGMDSAGAAVRAVAASAPDLEGRAGRQPGADCAGGPLGTDPADLAAREGGSPPAGLTSTSVNAAQDSSGGQATATREARPAGSSLPSSHWKENEMWTSFLRRVSPLDPDLPARDEVGPTVLGRADADEEAPTPGERPLQLPTESQQSQEEKPQRRARDRRSHSSEPWALARHDSKPLTTFEATLLDVFSNRAPRAPPNLKSLRKDILRVSGVKRYGLAVLGSQEAPLLWSTLFLKQLGARVSTDVSHRVVVVTASMLGVEQTFMAHCKPDIEHRHLTLQNNAVGYTRGQAVTTGESSLEVRGALVHVADIIIVIEATAESAADVRAAFQRGAKVIPVKKYGGNGFEEDSFPTQALSKPAWASTTEWEHLDDGLDPKATADAVLTLIRQLMSHHPRRRSSTS